MAEVLTAGQRFVEEVVARSPDLSQHRAVLEWIWCQVTVSFSARLSTR